MAGYGPEGQVYECFFARRRLGSGMCLPGYSGLMLSSRCIPFGRRQA